MGATTAAEVAHQHERRRPERKFNVERGLPSRRVTTTATTTTTTTSPHTNGRRVCPLTATMAELSKMSDAATHLCGDWLSVTEAACAVNTPRLTQYPHNATKEHIASAQTASVRRAPKDGRKNKTQLSLRASSQPRKVCVIGAGASGLIVLKELLEAGVDDVVVYEAQKGVGGLYLRDDYELGCHTSSYCYTSYACFPPEDVTQCGHYTLGGYVRYLEAFVDEFDLRDHIQFETRVLRVRRDGPEGDWIVTTQNAKNVTETLRFEHVACCSGTHTNKDPPRSHEWVRGFKGEVIHSSEYRTPKKYANKRVVICGGGESASDISVQTAKVAEKTWLAMRERTGHVTPRGAHKPEDDHKTAQRAKRHAQNPNVVPPESAFDTDLTWMMYSCSDAVFPVQAYRDVLALATRDFMPGCKLNVYYKSNVYSQFGTKNCGFSSAIARYECQPKPPVKYCDGNNVVFEDGTTAHNVDALVLCIGYRNDIAFLDDVLKCKLLNPRNCLNHVHHPDVSNFYLVGFVRPSFGNVPTIAEMQARWIASLISGIRTLPSRSAMIQKIEHDREWEESSFGKSGQRLKALSSYYHQMMDLATYLDAHPDYGELIFTDPILFLKLCVGQFSGFYFKLRDPDPCERAKYRDIIMKMPVSGVWHWDLAIILTAFHTYLAFGGVSPSLFNLKGNAPFQRMHPNSRRATAVLLLLNPLYLIFVALPAFLVAFACWLLVNTNTVRLVSNVDGLRGVERTSPWLLDRPFANAMHRTFAKMQLVIFLMCTTPYEIFLTVILKKHLVGQSHVPTSKFMEAEQNYKHAFADFAFAWD